MDIQEIQLDDSVYAMTANLQRRDKDGKADEKYYWLDKNMAKSFLITDGSKGAWVTQTMQEIDPPVIIREGDCVQVDFGVKADGKIQNNGEVSDGDITYAARAGFNFVGNAYPAPLNIQDIQLDDSVYAMTANLQRRDKDGKAVEKYYWLDKNMAKSFLITDGSKGAWVTQTMQKIDPPIILDPGEGVQVDVGVKADALITTLAPIEL